MTLLSIATLIVGFKSMADGFMMSPRLLMEYSMHSRSVTPTKMGLYMQHETTAEQGDNYTSLLSTLLSTFQGDFDNYNQVYSDRKNGLLPREGGGHEHFHVTLLPISADRFPANLFPVKDIESSRGVVVAAYYFDGMPNRIFRLRMYTLYCDDDNLDQVKMKLYTFDPLLEGKLRKESEAAIEKWDDIVGEHVSEHQHDSFKELERCDILWTREPDSVRHAYLETYSHAIDTENFIDPVHAIMVNDHEKGGVLLESQMMPGSFIRIQDELSLWKNELWINDRGHDAESKAMIYGNWEGVPYQMSRLTSLSSRNGTLEREIVDPDLRWTLGDKWRSLDEYESKMAAVGGVTTRMNKNIRK
jgi:hypothetical protein